MRFAGVLFSSLLLLSGCDEAQPSRSQRIEANKIAECQMVKQALDAVVYVRNRLDLAENEPCRRILHESCDYQVELQFELLALEMPIMSEKLGQTLSWANDCADELAFARKHGLQAFRDHRQL